MSANSIKQAEAASQQPASLPQNKTSKFVTLARVIVQIAKARWQVID